MPSKRTRTGHHPLLPQRPITPLSNLPAPTPVSSIALVHAHPDPAPPGGKEQSIRVLQYLNPLLETENIEQIIQKLCVCLSTATLSSFFG